MRWVPVTCLLTPYLWPNRDPIGEEGGINLYLFCANNSIYGIDSLGLDVNVVGRASCDMCGKGPQFDGKTTTLSARRYHVWGRTWQPNHLEVNPPQIGKLPIDLGDRGWPLDEIT
jgi:hypothetical protein